MDTKDVTVRFGTSSVRGAARVSVLVVEADAREADRIGRELNAFGFEVEIAVDFREARDRLLNDRFQAVVCCASDGGGLDLLTLARAYDSDVPFMLMVDERSLGGVAEAMRMGVTQYVLKPLAVPQIAATLKDCLSRRDARRPGQQQTIIQVDDLTPALKRAHLALQPIVMLSPNNARQIYGYEALLRSSEAKLASPAAIFDAAGRLGRIIDVGRRVRGLAAELASAMQGATVLFINLHAQDLNDEELFDPRGEFSKIASRVVLEVSERVDQHASLKERIASLRAIGFRIAIDDLGAGYAGLSSFATLEPDYVKLDMALVREIHTSNLKRSVVKSVIELARKAGVQVIAEGVEVDAELRCLEGLGVRLAQGYMIGMPAPRVKAAAV
jgi:EAL domain-containing protein (putative c-di-GMP-specific phosphodiesterase class I)